MLFFVEVGINYNMTNPKKKNFFKENFMFVIELLKQCKLKTIILSSFVLVAFLTGIIVAIKTNANYDTLSSLGVISIGKGGFNSSFFARLLSMLFIMLICFGCSFCKYLFPLAVLFLSYRGYLLGINITLIIVLNGIGGIITAVLIALPCQLVALAVLGLFYILFSKSHDDNCRFGKVYVKNQQIRILCLSFLLLLAICALQSILLAIFSPKVILVL